MAGCAPTASTEAASFGVAQRLAGALLVVEIVRDQHKSATSASESLLPTSRAAAVAGARAPSSAEGGHRGAEERRQRLALRHPLRLLVLVLEVAHVLGEHVDLRRLDVVPPRSPSFLARKRSMDFDWPISCFPSTTSTGARSRLAASRPCARAAAMPGAISSRGLLKSRGHRSSVNLSCAPPSTTSSLLVSATPRASKYRRWKCASVVRSNHDLHCCSCEEWCAATRLSRCREPVSGQREKTAAHALRCGGSRSSRRRSTRGLWLVFAGRAHPAATTDPPASTALCASSRAGGSHRGQFVHTRRSRRMGGAAPPRSSAETAAIPSPADAAVDVGSACAAALSVSPVNCCYPSAPLRLLPSTPPLCCWQFILTIDKAIVEASAGTSTLGRAMLNGVGSLLARRTGSSCHPLTGWSQASMRARMGLQT